MVPCTWRRYPMPAAAIILGPVPTDSFKNRRQLEQSDICGCLYCLAVYPPSEVVEWVTEDSAAPASESGQQ